MYATAPKYDIIITESAERAFFEILDYLFRHYSESRAESIARDLLDEPLRLTNFPKHGAPEPSLISQSNEYRYLLYERHKYATIKIIYYIDELNHEIYDTDFFPTEMHPSKVFKKGRTE